MTKKRLIELIATTVVIIVIVGGAITLSLGATVFCHRVIGPFVTGSNDPLVIATYCRGPGK